MIHLSKSQQHVVDEFPGFLLDDSTEMTIAGFAGSGKSFLVKYLADIAGMQQQLVQLIDMSIPERQLLFTATTNKAAEVLRNFLGREVSTIHSLLGLRVKDNYKTGKQDLVPTGNGAAISNSVIFIDEASMIDAELLRIIRDRVKKATDCKIVFIGDKYQLPPVMEDVCPVFQESPRTFFLNEIQRQVAGNPIIQLSAEYRNMLDDIELDWPDIISQFPNIIMYDNEHKFLEEMRDCFLTDHAPDDYKILAWSNSRVIEYNNFIRHHLGKGEAYDVGEVVVTNKPLITEGNFVIAPTDSLVYIRSIEPSSRTGIDGYDVVLDSAFGHTFFLPKNWHEAAALAKTYAKDAATTKNWEPYFSIQKLWVDLRPIHASTVHKAQGSTYREVFIDLNNIGQNNSWREVARLVYVAMTRASQTVHIYGELTKKYNKVPLIDYREHFKNVKCL